MTALELITETIDFYSTDTSRRGVTESIHGHITCSYQSENGNKCAVGRCMTEDALEKYYDFQNNVEKLPDFESLLLPQYQGHDIEFWRRLQRLHDATYNWDENGLTTDGQKIVDNLIKTFVEN